MDVPFAYLFMIGAWFVPCGRRWDHSLCDPALHPVECVYNLESRAIIGESCTDGRGSNPGLARSLSGRTYVFENPLNLSEGFISPVVARCRENHREVCAVLLRLCYAVTGDNVSDEKGSSNT